MTVFEIREEISGLLRKSAFGPSTEAYLVQCLGLILDRILSNEAKMFSCKESIKTNDRTFTLHVDRMNSHFDRLNNHIRSINDINDELAAQGKVLESHTAQLGEITGRLNVGEVDVNCHSKDLVALRSRIVDLESKSPVPSEMSGASRDHVNVILSELGVDIQVPLKDSFRVVFVALDALCSRLDALESAPPSPAVLGAAIDCVESVSPSCGADVVESKLGEINRCLEASVVRVDNIRYSGDGSHRRLDDLRSELCRAEVLVREIRESSKK